MAICLSHFYAYNEINQKYDYGLILEDDVLFCENFMNVFNNYTSQLPDSYDMLFLGDGCNFHIPYEILEPDKNVYRKCLEPTDWGGNGATRYTDSYLVSKKCANKLYNFLNNYNVMGHKIDLPVDWWLNVASRINDLDVYWAEPTIVTQGTQSGLFFTSHV